METLQQKFLSSFEKVPIGIYAIILIMLFALVIGIVGFR